ncbi:MAG: hypothetical protein ABI891_00880 [Acidobacteriota bacterium]
MTEDQADEFIGLLNTLIEKIDRLASKLDKAVCKNEDFHKKDYELKY